MPPPHTKLLIVEDDPDICRALATYARVKGYDVLTAADGRDAVKLGTAEHPQVILLDISLPGMDGRDVYVALEKAGITQDAVVVFTTAHDAQTDRVLGLELGAAEYETKPIHLQLFFQKLERLLEKKRAGEI